MVKHQSLQNKFIKGLLFNYYLNAITVFINVLNQSFLIFV